MNLDPYPATVYPTALGDIRRGHTSIRSPEVFIVGPQECTHHLSVREARAAAEAILRVCDEIEEVPGTRA